jgi:hypothetical protein
VSQDAFIVLIQEHQKLKNASQYLTELEQFADEKSDELELL